MRPVIHAIGDVRGRDALPAELHDRIGDVHRFVDAGRPAEPVHLGDRIGGGRDAIAVIDRLMRGRNGCASTCLIGNHDAVLLAHLETDDRARWRAWPTNGCEATLASLGVPRRFGSSDPAAPPLFLRGHRPPARPA